MLIESYYFKKFEKNKIVWQLSKTFVAQFDDFVACNCG